MQRTRIAAILALTAGLLTAATTNAQVGTAFTYQGELRNAGVPFSGTADIRITLADAATGGSLLGTPVVFLNVPVDAQGRFTVQPDFGTTLAFLPGGVYLNLEVRAPADPTSAQPFVTLSPRQKVMPAPLAAYAGFAAQALTADSAATAGDAQTLGGNDESFFRNAANLNLGTLPDARLSSNAVLLNAPQTFTATKTFGTGVLALRNPANTFSLSVNAGGLTAGRTVTFADATGTVITTGNRADLTLSGDVIGTAAASTVNAIRGVSVSGVAPASGQVLTYNGSQWAPTAPPVPAASLNGDVIGGYLSNVVRSIQGISVNASPPTANQVLLYNGSQWVPGSVPIAAGTGLVGIPGGLAVAGNGVGNLQLASDAASLAKVSGGALTSSGGNVNAPGNVTATGAITAGTNMTADAFLYTAAQISYVMIPDAAFTSRDGVGVFKTLGNGGANPISATSAGLTAPVNLPDGAVITGVQFYAVDNNATLNLTCSLVGYTPSTGTFSPNLAIGTTAGASTAVQTLTSGTLNLSVNNSLRSWMVIVSTAGVNWSDSTARILGVRVEYTMARPAR